MSPVLKTELLALLRGSGQLAETVEWDDADHAIPRRLGEEWTDDSEHTSLWEVVEADARKLGGRRSSGVIFQELIWYAVTAWQIAKGVESGDDPIKRERERPVGSIFCTLPIMPMPWRSIIGTIRYLLGAEELLMPLLKAVEIRLVRPMSEPNWPPPVFHSVFFNISFGVVRTTSRDVASPRWLGAVQHRGHQPQERAQGAESICAQNYRVLKRTLRHSSRRKASSQNHRDVGEHLLPRRYRRT